MNLKAILFDLDDTLYDGFIPGDREGFSRCGQYAAEHLGIPAETFSDAMLRARQALKARLPREPEIHDRVLFAQYALESLGQNPIPHAEALHDLYWSGVLDRIAVRPGVPMFLDELRACGIAVVVCTNMLAGIQMRKIRQLGLAERADFLVTSEEAGRDKPDAAIFRLALYKAGCAASEALMVGDNFVHDISGAHQVGITGLWLHVHGEPAPQADFPFAEASSFTEAADLIRQRFLR